MRIEKLNIYKISLPFTGDFSISRLTGASSNIIVVEAIADQGEIKGYGEAVPVEFITGETQESTARSVGFFAQKRSFPWELDDVSQIWDFVDTLPRGKEHNAAICASEMALLDALGKGQRRSIIHYFPHKFFTAKIYYGATIPLSNKQRTIELCKFAGNLGLTNLRIKMGKDFEQNRDAMEAVRSVFGDECDIRVDPNGAWDRDLAFKHMPMIRKYKVKVVEQPMISANPAFGEFAEALSSKGVSLMACESAPTLNHVKDIIKQGFYDIINIKLSRCGGFRRSFGIIDHVRKNGLSFQIGCQIGESGILSAAGRVLCLLCRDARYYDGSYGSFLLKKNVTLEDVSFGPCGEAGPLEGPGLGVEVSRRSLENLRNDGSPVITVLRP